MDMLDGVFDHLIFIFRKGKPAQFVGFEGDLIDGCEDPPDLSVLLEIREYYSKKLKDKEREDHRGNNCERDQAGYRQKQGSLFRGNPVDQIKSRLRRGRKMLEAPAVLSEDLSQRRIFLFYAPACCQKYGEQQVRDQKAQYFAAKHIPVKLSGDRRHAPLLFVLLIYRHIRLLRPAGSFLSPDGYSHFIGIAVFFCKLAAHILREISGFIQDRIGLLRLFFSLK